MHTPAFSHTSTHLAIASNIVHETNKKKNPCNFRVSGPKQRVPCVHMDYALSLKPYWQCAVWNNAGLFLCRASH